MRISDWSSDVCSSDLHIHRVRVGGHQFQRLGHDRRQSAQAPELALVGLELRGGGQRAVHQQVRDLLERGPGGQVLDVVATVMEVIAARSEEHTSELQSLMRISYAVFCLKKKTK